MSTAVRPIRQCRRVLARECEKGKAEGSPGVLDSITTARRALRAVILKSTQFMAIEEASTHT